MTWVYLRSEGSLWTVGFYDPRGRWQPENDYNNPEAAAKRVAWLNGGRVGTEPGERCMQCNGELVDHLEVIGESSNGGETHDYRCLVNALGDVIGDMETAEPGVEDEWLDVLKHVLNAYKAGLRRG